MTRSTRAPRVAKSGRRRKALRCPLFLEELEPRLTPASTFDITSIAPIANGSVAGGQSITITTTAGSTAFSSNGTQLVQFGGGTTQTATRISANQISVVAPVSTTPGTPGPVALAITDTMTSGPQTTTGSNTFTFNPITISAIDPNTGYITGTTGHAITISASDAAHGFGVAGTVNQLAVGFTPSGGGTTVFTGSIQYVSQTAIKVDAPPVSAIGTYTVSVYVNGTAASVPATAGANNFTYTAAPAFTSASVYITDNTGTLPPGDQIYLLLAGNKQYYKIGTDGQVTATGSSTTTTALSALPLDTSTNQRYFTLPVPFTSARLYFTTDQSLTQQPAAYSPTAYYDYVEPNLVAGGSALNVDTSQVDQFGMPITIQVTPLAAGHAAGAGISAGITRANIFQQYQTDMVGAFAPYQDSIVPGTVPYQILAPQYVIGNQINGNTVIQQAAGTSITITPAGGTAGQWLATLALPATLSPAKGSIVSGPHIPAGTFIQSITGTTATIVNTSTSTVTPFTANTITIPAAPTGIGGTGLNFIPVPPSGFTKLASWFGPAWGSTTNLNTGNAIDDLFQYYKTHNFYQEDNGNGIQLYTGKVKTITAADINGGTSTYTVLQFTNSGNTETYNIFYPYFTTNSPVGKTDPSGNQVPPPPAYFTLGNSNQQMPNYLPPSQMVFGASGVFADQLAQTVLFPSVNSTVLADLERDVAAALIRGYGTSLISTSNSLTGGQLPTFAVNPTDSTKGTWTLTSPADIALASSIKSDGMYLSSFQALNFPMKITKVTPGSNSVQIEATFVNLPTTTSLTPDNLQFFYLYQTGTTYDAYSAFMQSRGAFTSGVNGNKINIDGRAYGDPYSDFMDFSSDLNSVPNPQGPATQTATLQITLGPWGTPTTPPIAPTQLVATAGDAQVSLQWQPSAGATSYNVYRTLTSHGTPTAPIATGVTGTTYLDTGLTNGTTYYYYVKAVNGAGPSPASNEVSATPSASNPPPPPTNVTATGGNAQVVLSWTASPGATSYEVYRGTTSRGESPTPIATGITTTGYPDNAVTNGTTYFYYVKAVSGAGSSLRSHEVSATPMAPAPAAPTGLTAVGSTGQVLLNWTASAGAATYNVYRGTTAGGESPTPIATGIAVTTYSDTSVTGGITYFYYVKAVASSGGISAASNEASATPPAATPPAPPTGLTAQPGDTNILLTWNASANANSYNLYRGITSGGESPTPVNTSPITTTSYHDTGLTNGTTYYYFVKAVNNAGNSLDSNEAFATPTASQPPSAPTQLTASAGNSKVVLNWNASPGATGYNVYRGVTSGGETSPPLASNVSGTTYTDIQVTNGVTYFYVVTAIDAHGESADSNEASATPVAPAPPAPPTSLTAQPGNGTVLLQWTASAGATGYKIYRATTSGGEVSPPINASPVTGTTYSDSGLTNGTTYYYVVTAINSAGESLDSNEASATPTNTQPPPAPTDLAATGGFRNVALRWTASPNAVSYNVYRGTSSGGEQAPALVSGLATPTYTDTAVANGTTYYYVVTAVDGSGNESHDSNEASATPVKATPGLTIVTFDSPIQFGALPQTYTTVLTVPGAGAPAPTGSLSLLIDGNTIGTSSTYTSVGNGQYEIDFTYSGSALTGGNHALMAVFTGDANYNSTSSAEQVQVVDRAAVSLTFPGSAVDPNPIKVGDSVTYSVNMTTSVAAGLPAATGTVQFSARNVDTGVSTVLGTSSLTSTGANAYSASLTQISPLGPGTYDITATYLGNSNYATGSTLTPASQTVNPTPVMRIAYTNPPLTLMRSTKAVFNIDVSNIGTAGDTNVFITQTLPANTTFVPGLSSPGWMEAFPGTYRKLIGDVAVGEHINVNFAVATSAASVVGQVVTATASVFDTASPNALWTVTQSLTIRGGSVRWPGY